jgi:uncharacterized membrane protein
MTDQPLPSALTMSRALRDNIETLSARARDEAANAPLSHRIAERITAFSGSMTFVVVHLVLVGLWIAANTSGLPGVPRFDPSLVVLAMAASVEAIFLSTFVLISQNRMAATAKRSADLDLHINLLTEHELTRIAILAERIAERLDISVDDLELAEIEADVEPAEVLDALEEQRVENGQPE